MGDGEGKSSKSKLGTCAARRPSSNLGGGTKFRGLVQASSLFFFIWINNYMKVTEKNIQGEVKRETDVYTVIDNAFLPNLTLSKTILHPNQKTSGHVHDDLDEVYFFISGTGQIKLDDDFIDVEQGSVILIKGGIFHQVFNKSAKTDLEFNCVFQQYTR